MGRGKALLSAKVLYASYRGPPSSASCRGLSFSASLGAMDGSKGSLSYRPEEGGGGVGSDAQALPAVV